MSAHPLGNLGKRVHEQKGFYLYLLSFRYEYRKSIDNGLIGPFSWHTLLEWYEIWKNPDYEKQIRKVEKRNFELSAKRVLVASQYSYIQQGIFSVTF